MSSLPADHHLMLPADAFREHLDYLRAIGRAPQTIDRASEVLHRAERELPAGLCAAFPEEIVGWFASHDWAPKTRRTYRSHIRRFFAWANHGPNPCLDEDPSAGIEAPRVPDAIPRPATDEQVRQACTRARMPWRLHCILAAYAGLRCCEIAQLDRADVTELDILVHGKGGRDRVVPSDDYVWASVKDLPPGPVTRPRNGRAPDAQWVSASTIEHLKWQLGVDATLHRFRAWYATRALDACGDILVVKELLGHASVATTQVYTLVNPDRRRAAVAGLPRLIG